MSPASHITPTVKAYPFDFDTHMLSVCHSLLSGTLLSHPRQGGVNAADEVVCSSLLVKMLLSILLLQGVVYTYADAKHMTPPCGVRSSG